MALTTLDPKTALVVIDLQNGILTLPTVHPVEGVLEKAVALADAFREHRLPVVFVTVAGGASGRTERAPRVATERPEGWADLAPALRKQSSDLLVTKRTWGAFASTDLDDKLKALGVTQFVLTGISTSSGVESTARQAWEGGYNVTLAVDAMTDTNAVSHENSIANVFPRLGETGTTEEVIALLAATRA
jgi:nicotinamidase-related amidase